VILILAALAYLQARPNSVPSGTTTNPCSCPYEPPTNLLQVSQPFTDVQVGISVPFSIELPYLTPTSFDYDFGDGTSFSTNSSTANYTYAGPGNYLVSVTAILSPGNFANVMTNNRSLVPVRALPLGSSSELAGLPVLEGTITSNSTTGTDPSVVIHAGDSVTLAAQYPITGPIPGYSVGPPTFLLAPNLTATTNVGQNSSTSTIVFPDPGIFVIVATGKITPSSAPSVEENYTWTVFVAPKDESASVVGQGTPVGAHPPLNLTAYELAPGGSLSEDPAIDYETVGQEPIENVYQTLITYNGTDLGPLPQDFVPVLATCVPGSEQCVRQWGVPLESPDQENYTFVLQSSARFYDPGTRASWPVYPSDVMFSVARDLAFSTLPS
jgi:PKD repeat protein